ncbi:hypothetical protein [Daejeonella sp. H1SJ63]|jgi:hypothetical protein|uniref:hypothetical protein n=1 Tax=Daejeonella sp. H1SJ63 TaxID=3034145 RepID=UPI0023ECE657|nr:hypothetical protein [Daejeonella sp. H1SJ63]
MKLLVITAIKEFKKDILRMFKEAGVQNFSYREVTGFQDNSEDRVELNWFASDMNENESILFYAFVKKESVDSFFNLVEVYNSKQGNESHVHLAVLNIEKSNN